MTTPAKITRRENLGFLDCKLDDLIARFVALRESVPEAARADADVQLYYTTNDDGVHVELRYAAQVKTS